MNKIEVTETRVVQIENGEELVGAIGINETVYIPLRQFCDHLSLDWSAQRRRTNRHGFYVDHVATVAMIATDGRTRQQLCLPIDFIHGWLLGIDPNRVKEPLTAKKIKLYQTVAHKMLYAAFTPMSEPGTEAKLVISLNLIPRMMENQVTLANDVEFLQMQMKALQAEIRGLKDSWENT
jgi:hypothetical protein